MKAIETKETSTSNDSPARIREVLARALDLEILSLTEVSALIALRDQAMWEEVFNASAMVKEKVYGKRVVLFAPLYLSNECMNNCLYCGFRRGNQEAKRKTLSIEEAVAEASILSSRGYKRLLLVTGELAGAVNYLEGVIDAIYKRTDIRILHVNSAPMGLNEFKRLKASGAGVYQCFQETYHIPTYRVMHPSGPKADYYWRLNVMDRAIDAGFEDVGMGVLLGLHDWRWDAFALIAHAHRLVEKYGFGPHTISVPRLQPAQGAELKEAPYAVSDSDFKKTVAIYRLALPYVGVVVSTREPAYLRDELLLIGASQISAGSRTSPAGYMEGGDTEQFEIGDRRNLEEVVGKIASMGLLPSFCTACYREGRSGDTFRHLAEDGGIKNLCQINAILSLKEYVEDYAPEELKLLLERRIKEEALKTGNGLFEKLQQIEKGKRDIHV
ncbi:MAG: [FeFe] hydrogenase H-cluster radical SAM maturase HydG [Nitrospirae bacterium]|nr:[FeFe] hydrogenase H-cluster radical SAM maturase HydG [Nitrospirota bacterium]